MGKTLYVGNLPYQLSEDDLRDLFSQVGPVVEVRIVTDPVTGQARGFGFVDMATEEDAQAAIQRLNGAEVGGRAIRVSEAHERRSS